ncbi:germ cell nuclear acidic protein-like isoform X2 [Argiope bruennichi]|nr:germ cell nuclear acidic protein-like isoform X2 [Argiope bruennichi]
MEMKKGLPIEFENENTSRSILFAKNRTPLRKQASESAAVDENEERLYHVQEEKSKSLSDISINLDEMESEAQKNFKRNRDVFTQKLYHFFNRKIFNNRLPKDMSVTWSDYLRTTAGYTRCSRDKLTNTYSCKIELASKVLTSFDRLRDTLLHEMCHAAVWVVNQQKSNHGPLWQMWADRCNLILPNVQVPTRCHNYEIEYKFTYRCKNCPWKIGRHSKCSRFLELKCPKCYGSIYCVKS